jgi:hypothetical protein
VDYVESMGSPWKPVGDCKIQTVQYTALNCLDGRASPREPASVDQCLMYLKSISNKP